MTDTTNAAASTAQLDRIAQLRAKRGQSAPLPKPSLGAAPTAASAPTDAPAPRKRRKRHVAQGSRILAAGLGASTMFGIVGVLGVDHPLSPSGDSVPTPVVPAAVAPTPPPIQVVVHRIPAAATVASEPAVAVADASLVDAPAAEPTAPIVLTANPVVQTVTLAAPAQASSPAPAATTSGSN